MKKSYEQFKLEDVIEQLGLNVDFPEKTDFFDNLPEVPLSDEFRIELKNKTQVALIADTEKARSEFIVATILFKILQLKDKKISIYSGNTFNIDPKNGLKGRCDFILGLGEANVLLKNPLITIVEAKNDNLNNGLGQCAAEMYAAQIFNNKKGINHPIYGVVTTGSLWKFMKLEEKTVYIEAEELFLDPVERILGIFLKILS